MAERRMFAKTIIDSDAFLDMPTSAQALYFHMAMRADDDGFLNNPKKIQRIVGASEDDLKLLLVKRFIIAFESGVVVIKHWRLHNYIQKDRYKPTVYQEELDSLTIKDNGVYTDCIHDVYELDTQVSIGKVSIEEDKNRDSLEKEREGALPRSRSFTPPSLEEVDAYCQERNNGIDAQTFIDYYSARGWMMNSKNKMKDWKAAVRTWEQRHKEEQQQKQSNKKFTTAAEYVPPKPKSMEDLRRMIDMI